MQRERNLGRAIFVTRITSADVNLLKESSA